MDAVLRVLREAGFANVRAEPICREWLVADPRDLIEDARRATLGLKAKGIDVFGVTLDPSGVGSGVAVFGRGQHMPVRRLEDLPLRLAALYFRLARR